MTVEKNQILIWTWPNFDVARQIDHPVTPQLFLLMVKGIDLVALDRKKNHFYRIQNAKESQSLLSKKPVKCLNHQSKSKHKARVRYIIRPNITLANSGYSVNVFSSREMDEPQPSGPWGEILG